MAGYLAENRTGRHTDFPLLASAVTTGSVWWWILAWVPHRNPLKTVDLCDGDDVGSFSGCLSPFGHCKVEWRRLAMVPILVDPHQLSISQLGTGFGLHEADYSRSLATISDEHQFPGTCLCPFRQDLDELVELQDQALHLVCTYGKTRFCLSALCVCVGGGGGVRCAFVLMVEGRGEGT